MSDPRIIIIILNTNRRNDTLACLESVAKSTYSNLGIIVLDNNSTDGSVEAIKEKFEDVFVHQLTKNLGYAGNNNVGIKLGLDQGADWVFLLNEDTLVEPDCFNYLLDSIPQIPNLGILGPMVYTFDEGNIISSAGGKIDWWKADSINVGAGEVDQGQYPSRFVDFINGCGLLISREVIEKTGLLDESFFIYWEETDWCQRVLKSGFKIYFNSSAKMRHKAPIDYSNFGPTTLYYVTRNRIRFFLRHTKSFGKLISVPQATFGALKGSLNHWRSGRSDYARATLWAIFHAFIGKAGKVDPVLWQSTKSDRTLYNT
jgi:GT2 family glycosyltransferase